MKGMQKISRGGDFSGVVDYVFYGEEGKVRAHEAELIGGNLAGMNPENIKKEFALSRQIRPDVTKPVWHNSLRLPQGEKISNEQWRKIADAYMERMGFYSQHQRIYVLHDDEAGQHIHIVASRIDVEGKLFLGKNENLKSTRIIAGLEREFSLSVTKTAEYNEDGKVEMPSKSQLTKREIEKANRTGKEPVKQQLQKIINTALDGKKVSLTNFVERLEASGVSIRPNTSKDKINGFSFSLDGVSISGSKLGADYKYNSLETRGLTYDKNRECALVERLIAEARPGADDAGTAKPDRDAVSHNHSASQQDRPGAEISAGQGSEDGQSATTSDEKSAAPGAAAAIPEDRAAAQADEPAKSAAGAGHAVPGPERAGPVSPGLAVGGGVDLTDVGIIRTGNKAIDELATAAKRSRMQQEKEALARQRRMYEEQPHVPPVSHKAFLAMLKALSQRLAPPAPARKPTRAEGFVAKALPSLQPAYHSVLGAKTLRPDWLRSAYEKIERDQNTDPLSPGGVDRPQNDKLVAQRLADLGMPPQHAFRSILASSRAIRSAEDAAQMVAGASVRDDDQQRAEELKTALLRTATDTTTRTDQERMQAEKAEADRIAAERKRARLAKLEEERRQERRQRDKDEENGFSFDR